MMVHGPPAPGVLAAAYLPLYTYSDREQELKEEGQRYIRNIMIFLVECFRTNGRLPKLYTSHCLSVLEHPR